MPETRTTAIAILALTTVTAAGVAWHNHRRAEALAHELAASREAQAASELRLADRLSRSRPMPEDDPFAEAGDPAELMEDNSGPPQPVDRPPQRFNRRNGTARLEELMQNPQFAQAFQLQATSQLDGRYAELFRQLNLSPAALDQLKTLLVERQNAWRDVVGAARSEGLSGRENRDELRTLVEMTQNEIAADIRQLIGDNGLAELERYEATTAQRGMIDQLANRLSYSGTPLNSGQTEALLAIFTAPTSTDGAGATRFQVTSTGPGGDRTAFASSGSPMITDEIIARAQGVLAPDQVAALQQLQAEQAAQRTVGAMMRSQLRDRAPRPASPNDGG